MKLNDVLSDVLEYDDIDQISKDFPKFFGGFNKKEVNFNDLMTFDLIQNMIADGLLTKEDAEKLWIATVGDAESLNEGEAFEFVAMLVDIPDPEDLEYFKKEFAKLIDRKTKKVSFVKFLSWKDMYDIINDEALTMEQITELWRKVAKDLNSPIDLKTFVKLNIAIDNLIEDLEEENGDSKSSDDNPSTGDIDVWSPDFNAETVFEADALKEIKAFWDSRVNGDNLLSKDDFFAWDDMKDIVSEGLPLSRLETAWNEGAAGGQFIDFDKFLRLNVKIDLLLDEIESTNPPSKTTTESASEETKAQDSSEYYRSLFVDLSQGKGVLTLKDLLSWDELDELIRESVISVDQIKSLYTTLPKAAGKDTEGISVESFLLLNTLLDVMIDKKESSTSSKPAALIPSGVTEPQIPRPSEGELKMFSLGKPEDFSSDEELSSEELEMMNVLDKADTLLNEGSFSTFDDLIGDKDDPRLLAAKAPAQSTLSVANDVDDIVKNLQSIASEQIRCGLVKPTEEVETTIRDLCQAVVEKAPKVVNRINDVRKLLIGKWKLLYTNSEMFNFYNGVTGLSNVFPGSSFSDLSLEYASDGYLSEAKYLENFKTPLGETVAVVNANWDLTKETSFITNENCLTLRAYCTQVTAGPMKYRAEENWKSLRTLSMNEIVYIDENFLLMRNSGALRVFFILQRSV